MYYKFKFLLLSLSFFIFSNNLSAQGTWIKKSDFGGSSRVRAVSFSIDSIAYLGTGKDTGLQKDFWSYDQLTDSWTQKADFGGTAREDAVGFSLLDKGYIGTGSDVNGVTNDMWEYDPSLNSWTQKNDFGGIAREGAVVATLNNKAYVSVGRDATSYPTDIWEYDPTLDTWTEKATFPSDGRVSAFAFGINNKIYVGNGFNYASGSMATNNVWEFNPALNTWIEKNIFTGILTGSNSYFTLADKGYFLTSSSSGEFYEYNPTDDSWTGLASFGTAGNNNRSDATSFVLGNIAYIATGYYTTSSFTTTYKKELWAFGLDATLPPSLRSIQSKVVALNQINLSWAEGLENAIGIRIEKTVNFTGTYSLLAIIPANATSYSDIDNGFVQDYQYSYRIASFNVFGNSTFFSTTSRVPYHVEKPSDLLASPKSAKQIDLTWNELAIDETGFRIERSENDNTNFVEIAVVGADTTFYQDKNLTAGTTYYYRVRTTDFVDNSAYSNESSATPTDIGVWTRQSDFSVSKYSAVAFSINGKGYLGTGDSDETKTAFWEYDPITDVWTQKANFLGGGRKRAVGFSIGTKGYISTGESYNFATSTQTTYKDLWEYDPTNNFWAQKANLGGIARSGAVAFVINGKAYLGLGNELGSKDFWEYNPATDNWTQVADFTGAGTNNWGTTGLSINDKGYVFDLKESGNVWEYDPVLDVWNQKTNMVRTNNQWSVGFSIGNKGYLGTGGSDSEDFWEYDPSLDKWTQIANFGGGLRQTAVAFAIGNKGYVGLGYYREQYSPNSSGPVRTYDIWSFNPNAPNSPTELSAIGSFANSKIDLTWFDNSSSETSFLIEKSVGDNQNFALINISSTNATSYSDVGVTAGLDYFYRVRSVNGSDSSNYTNEVLVDLPGIPRQAINLSAIVLNNSQLVINWTDDTNNELGFIIERSMIDNGNYEKIDTVSADIESFTDILLTSNTPYFYRLLAYNNFGNSPVSMEVSATTYKYLPETPSELTLNIIDYSQIELNWIDNSTAEIGFIISRSEDNDNNYQIVDSVSINTVTYIDTNLKSNTNYFYQVYAYGKDSNSFASNSANEKTPMYIPETANSLALLEISPFELLMEWVDASTNESGFIIEKSINDNSNFVNIDTVAANTTNYSDSSLVSNTSYFYRVISYSKDGNSTPSNEATLTTSLYIPKAPENPTLTILSTTEILINWTDMSSNELGFIIERSINNNASFQKIDSVGANEFIYTDSTVNTNNTYYYRILSYAKDGNSAPSQEKSIDVPIYIPNPPTSATAIAISPTEAELTWTDNSEYEFGFIIERSINDNTSFEKIDTVGIDITNILYRTTI